MPDKQLYGLGRMPRSPQSLKRLGVWSMKGRVADLEILRGMVEAEEEEREGAVKPGRNPHAAAPEQRRQTLRGTDREISENASTLDLGSFVVSFPPE